MENQNTNTQEKRVELQILNLQQKLSVIREKKYITVAKVIKKYHEQNWPVDFETLKSEIQSILDK